MMKKPLEEDKPPILGSWRNIYVLVIVNLIVLIILFKLITNYFT